MSIRLKSQITVNLSSNNPAYLISRSNTRRCMILTVISKRIRQSTFALLAASAFSLMSSFNIFKFPNLAATCTAVSPFYKKTTLITNDKQPVTSSLKRTRLNLYNQGEKRMVISHLLWEGMKDRRSLGKNRIQPSWRGFFPPPLPRTSLLPPRTSLLPPPSRFSPYLRIITSDMLTLLPCLLCYLVCQHPLMFNCK